MERATPIRPALPGIDSDTTHGTPPPEVDPGASRFSADWWVGRSTYNWNVISGATSYRLYRGLLGDLPKLLTSGTTDSCIKYAGSSTSATDVSDPSMVAGNLYWYLVTASNAYGEDRLVTPRRDRASSTARGHALNKIHLLRVKPQGRMRKPGPPSNPWHPHLDVTGRWFTFSAKLWEIAGDWVGSWCVFFSNFTPE